MMGTLHDIKTAEILEHSRNKCVLHTTFDNTVVFRKAIAPDITFLGESSFSRFDDF